MQRKIYSQMSEWKDSDNRKPLMIFGPRQVGKTYSAISFARQAFKNHVLFNFQESRELWKIFDRDLDPKKLVKELSAYSQESIDEDTLLIFDEIQECDGAITSLKYFAEDMPTQPIISTGSLLGLITGSAKDSDRDGTRGPSFPVGKVKELHMHPMDLEEYAWATGRKELSDSIRMHFSDMSEMPLHDSAMDMYREYLAVGGMPEVVSAYVRTGSPDIMRTAQKGLDDSLIGDISKHAGSSDTVVRTLRAWNSMVSQLMKDNLKFQYSKIVKGARSSEYSTSIDWLTAARVVNRCSMVTEPTPPLAGFTDASAFRLFISDTGLLSSKAEVPFKTIVSGRASDRFRGVMAENYICQSLTANDIGTYYWNPDQNTELDFLFQDSDGEVVPIEVKSGDRTTSKSLAKFRKTYSPRSSIRLSSKNFGREDDLYSIPLYAAFCIDKGWADKVGEDRTE